MRTKVKVEADVDRSFFARIADKLRGIEAPSLGSGVNPTAGIAVAAAGLAVVARWSV